MGPGEIYCLPRGEYLVGCRPCKVVMDHGFHDRSISIGAPDKIVILYSHHESVFYEFDRVPGFVIIKCVSSRQKDLESRYFAVTEYEWRNFFRFGAAVHPTVSQKIVEAIERLEEDWDRGGLRKIQTVILLLAYDLLLTVKRIGRRFGTKGVTVLFQIWIRYYMSWISARHLSPKIEFPLPLLLIKQSIWDRCMNGLECKRLSLRYGDRSCCR